MVDIILIYNVQKAKNISSYEEGVAERDKKLPYPRSFSKPSKPSDPSVMINCREEYYHEIIWRVNSVEKGKRICLKNL